jgi:hypothetical protein
MPFRNLVFIHGIDGIFKLSLVVFGDNLKRHGSTRSRSGMSPTRWAAVILIGLKRIN